MKNPGWREREIFLAFPETDSVIDSKNINEQTFIKPLLEP